MNEQNIDEIISTLYDMVRDARAMPLAADKCILERDKVLDMLDEVIAQLPVELKQARTIVESRNELIGQARREAETIIRKAKEYGIAGGTVIKGALGYGLSTELRDTRYCELVEKFPIILNFIDEAEKIDGFAESILPWLQEQPKGCLVTTKDLNVLLAKKGDSKQ